MKTEKWNSIKTAKWMKTWLVVAVGVETDALHWQQKYYFLFEFQPTADAVKILKYFWFDFQCVRCALWLFVSTSMGASLAFNPIFPTKEFESYRKNWNWINVRSKKKTQDSISSGIIFFSIVRSPRQSRRWRADMYWPQRRKKWGNRTASHRHYSVNGSRMKMEWEMKINKNPTDKWTAKNAKHTFSRRNEQIDVQLFSIQ